jgi:putative phage-type endonuclease
MGVVMKNYTISGTEIGSILGLNPYQTPMDLYMRKHGLIDPPEENEAMKWGSAAEHVVARRYARETGLILFPSIDNGYDYKYPIIHPHDNWWVGTPDRMIFEPMDTSNDKHPGLLEIKIVGERMAYQWGEPPDGDVPEQYLTQCAWYMPLLDVEWADLAVQIGNRDYRVYRINRDREFENQLRDAALAFINDHLIPQIPPPIDGSESSKRYLNYRYPKEQGPILEPTDEDILLEIEGLQVAQKELKLWESRVAACQNILKSIIGDAAGMKGEWGKLTWTKNKNSQKVDWEGLAKSYNPPPVMINQYTKIKPGARVFRSYFTQED